MSALVLISISLHSKFDMPGLNRPKDMTSVPTSKVNIGIPCCVYLSPRKRGNMFSPALVCVSVCVSVCDHDN